MTREDFNSAMERLQRAATTVQAGLDRGGITASSDEVATLKGIARGLKRSAVAQVACPERDRLMVQALRDQVLEEQRDRLPGWAVNPRFCADGSAVLGLTMRRPVGPLTGAGLYGPEFDPLAEIAQLVETHAHGRVIA